MSNEKPCRCGRPANGGRLGLKPKILSDGTKVQTIVRWCGLCDSFRADMDVDDLSMLDLRRKTVLNRNYQNASQ